MYLADYHLHSTCSPDGKLTVAQIAEIALARGLQEICITDHLDTIYWGTYAPRTDFDWPALQQQVAEARALYGDRLVIRVGAELGEATISPERADILLQNAPPLDFIIGSVHTASRKFDYLDLYFVEKRDMDYYHAIMDDYLDETVKLLRYGKFHVLGHLTLPLRCIKHNTGLDLSFDHRTERLEEIFALMIDRGIGLELNTNRGAAPLPGAKLLQLYRRMGGQIVTIGSDAHAPEHIGMAVRSCQQLLRDTGWQYFATYDRGEPVFHRL